MLDVVKMDIEGMEWLALEQIIYDDLLSKIRYLLIEWHVCPQDFKEETNVDQAISVYNALLKSGFVKYFSDAWNEDEHTGCRMVLNYFLQPDTF